MATTISHRMSFVNKITVVLKASSDDENPTPGYLFKEINDITFESSGYSNSLVEFLVDRVKNKSCHVKFKVLKLMKHVFENGSSEFQIGLKRHSDSIKECTKFGGPPHPMHGNTPYIMVRQIAKELCEKLYSMETLAPKSPSEGTEEKPAEFKYGGLGPVRTGGAIQGFGNTPTSQSKGLGETILDGIEKLGAKMSETTSDRQAALLAKLDLTGSTINYQPPVIKDVNEESFQTSVPDREMEKPLSRSAGMPVKVHQPGKAGGGWGDDEDDDGEDSVDKNENESKQLSIETDSLADPSSRLQSEEPQTDWREETQLVAETLQQGSTGAQQVFLSPSTIKLFLSKCSTLSCDKAVEILAQKLASRDAGMILRALQLLEGIIYNREELISIDRLALTCKDSLVSCYLNSQSKFPPGNLSHHSPKAQKDFNSSIPLQEVKDLNTDKTGLWKSVEVKCAKTVLILQQLSSQKEILPVSHFSHFLPSPSVATFSGGELNTA